MIPQFVRAAPPGLSPPGLPAMNGCFAPATSVANRRPPETLSPGCLRHPGNILNDVSGVPPPTSGLDGPCDRSVLGEGPRPIQLILPTSNFLEFATSSDILHQQVVGQLQAVEASASPFHPIRLTTPSSPPPRAPAMHYSSRVKATPIQGRPRGA